MEINEENIIENVDEERALAVLLASGWLFLNHASVTWGQRTYTTTCVYVLASDTFAWASADGECILNNDGEEPSEIISLYKLYKEKSDDGVIEWLCWKRNSQPLPQIKNQMIQKGTWTQELEALPPLIFK